MAQDLQVRTYSQARGLALVVGLLTRLAAFGLALTMAGDARLLAWELIVPSHDDVLTAPEACAAPATGSTKRNAESVSRIRGAPQYTFAPANGQRRTAAERHAEGKL